MAAVACPSDPEFFPWSKKDSRMVGFVGQCKHVVGAVGAGYPSHLKDKSVCVRLVAGQSNRTNL